MSKKELRRVEVIAQLEAGRLKTKEASELLGLSQRQVTGSLPLLNMFKPSGDLLRHQNPLCQEMLEKTTGTSTVLPQLFCLS